MIDTIAVIDNDLIERMSMNNADRAYLLLEEGRKTEAALISTHPGGGAINAAVSFARLGCSVATLVKVGNDHRAHAIRDVLQSEGVCADYIQTTEAAGTGASVIVSAHERNAAIFTFRGANSLLEKSDVTAALAAGRTGKWDIVYITGLSDRSADVFPDIVNCAHDNGAFVTANPGIRQLAARGDAFHRSLSKISLLSMNREEAAAMLPHVAGSETSSVSSPKHRSAKRNTDPELMQRGIAASGFALELPQFCRALLNLGPRCIVITDGKHGAYAAVADDIMYCPSLATDVVGTAGAGDAFTSAFTWMYASGAPAGAALQYATVNASSVTQFADAQSGLLREPDLTRALTTNRDKLTLQEWQG